MCRGATVVPRPGLCSLSLLATVLLAQPSLADWNVQVLEPGRGFRSASLAIAPSGRPAVASHHGELIYHAYDGVGWVEELVDPTCSIGDVSLAFDAGGRPAISYESDGVLVLARRIGSRWIIVTVDDTGDAGDYNSLAFDGLDQPAVSYWDRARGALKLARTDGSAWALEELDSAARPLDSTSLAFDGAGTSLIAYTVLEEPGLRLASWSGTGWDIDVVDPEISHRASLVIDADDHPAIAYDGDAGMALARHDGSEWTIEVLDGGNYRCPSLAFDAAGLPAVGYLEPGPSGGGVRLPGRLKLARFDGTIWTHELVTDEDPYDSVRLAFDPSGEPAIAFIFLNNPLYPGGLSVARHDGAAWRFDTLGTTATAGTDASLAFDAAGHPAIGHIIYGPADEAGVRLDRWTGADWIRETAVTLTAATMTDAWDFAGTSVAFDTSDNPAVSFLERSFMRSNRLSLATWDAGWTVESLYESENLDYYWPTSLTFDATGEPLAACAEGLSPREVLVARPLAIPERVDQGHHATLASDPTGRPVLAYATNAPPGLALARLEAGSWVSEMVEGFTGKVSATSLAFGPTGAPAIGYLVEDGSTSLRYAHDDGAGWSIEEVTELDAQEPVSLAFDGAGQPGLSFVRRHALHSWYTLHYATRSGGGWSFDNVDTRGRSYPGPRSLGYDRDDRPLIAYQACTSLAIASPFGIAKLLRGVSDLGPGWKASALPLTSWNDDETPPFPLDTSCPGFSSDTAPPGERLLLYRVLWEGDRPARNTLRLVKQPTGVDLSY